MIKLLFPIGAGLVCCFILLMWPNWCLLIVEGLDWRSILVWWPNHCFLIVRGLICCTNNWTAGLTFHNFWLPNCMLKLLWWPNCCLLIIGGLDVVSCNLRTHLLFQYSGMTKLFFLLVGRCFCCFLIVGELVCSSYWITKLLYLLINGGVDWCFLIIWWSNN